MYETKQHHDDRDAAAGTRTRRRMKYAERTGNTPHHTGLADSSTSADSNDAEAKRPQYAGHNRNGSGAASRRSGCRASNDAPPSDRPRAAQRVRHGLATRGCGKRVHIV